MRLTAAGVARYAKIIELRGRGWTQAQIGDALDLHPESVGRIERGLRNRSIEIPSTAISGALWAAYEAAQNESNRARLLASIGVIAAEELRTRREELKLHRVRTEIGADESLGPPDAPPSPSVFDRVQGLGKRKRARMRAEAVRIINRAAAADDRSTETED